MSNELDSINTGSVFDAGFNNAYHEKYDQQSNIVSDIAGGAIASVADFGASVWNSLPGTDYVGTEQILANVSDNALRVYEEHPDAVHAASFLGGMFLPTGLALKGMQAARAGVKGINWFSAAGKAEDLSKIDKLFREGQALTPAYRAAKTELYAKGLANQALDAAAMEFALVGTMNAHPLLEDYMKDPVKNFALSVGIGGVIGGAIGHISDAYQVGKLEKAAEGGIVGLLQKDIKTVADGEQLASQVQVHQANIGTLENIIATKKAAGLNDSNDLSVQVASKYLLSTKAAQDEALLSMLSPAIKEVAEKNPEVKNTLLDMVINNGFDGVNKIDFINTKLGGSGNVLKMQAGNDTFVDNLVFAPKTLKFKNKLTGETEEVASAVDVAYSPEFGRFYSLKDVKHYARARDLGKSADLLAKEIPSTAIPNKNIAEEVFSANSASIDAYYLGILHKVDKMSVDQVKAIVLSSDDLPLRNAILARAAKEPDEFIGHKWKVTNNAPNYEAFNQQIITSQADKGIKATHLEDNFKFTNPETMKAFDLRDNYKGLRSQGLDGAAALIDRWMGGNKQPLAEAMENFRLGRGGLGEVIYNSRQSKALREEFAKNADSEGYVYLYRGLKVGKNVGHGTLDSYTTDPAKAAEFLGRDGSGRKTVGSVRLYKVKVDDIVGGIKDIPEGGGSTKKNEIIVRAATLDTFENLPLATAPATLAGVTPQEVSKVARGLATGVSEADLSTLATQLVELKDSTISSLLAQRVPFETIAIRTNTPLDTVKQLALSPEGTSVLDLAMQGAGKGHREYDSASKIKDYLDIKNRTLRLKSDAYKGSYARLLANLDVANRDTINKEIVSSVLDSSLSSNAKGLGSYFFSPERLPLLGLLRSKIGEFVNGGTGSRFFSSSDFNVRNMGDVGMIVTTIGKDMTKLTNNAIDSVLTPLNNLYSSLIKNPVAQIEYNTAVNVNASVKGWRTFDAETGQFFVKKAGRNEKGETVTVLEPVTFQGREFKVVSDEVKAIFSEHQRAGRELYEMKNSINKVLGKRPLNDIGLWIPSFNPKGKFIAYVHDKVLENTKLIWANTAEDLEKMILATKGDIQARGLIGKTEVITKGDQAAWNRINGRLDPLTMEVADISMQKTGSAASNVVKANTDILGEIAGGYEHYIGSHMRKLAELSMSDIMDGLTRMSQYNTRLYENQTLTPVTKMASQPKDTANIIKNTLIGNSNLSEYSSWRHINESFETGLSLTMNKVGQIWNEAVKPFVPKGIFSRKRDINSSDLAKINYEAISKKLEEAGAVNPWQAFDQAAAEMYGLARLTDHRDTSKRLIYASNALAATVALRVGELAQPLVNAMSLPILTGLATSQKMPETFMGIRAASSEVGGVQVMYEGMRAMHDPRFDSLRKLWEERGYFEPHISEANNTLKLARSFDRNAITHVENALDSNLVKILSKPADWSEQFVRKATMHTGAILAKRLYPELNDTGVSIFARDFMDKAIGNYHAAQRPVFFQGTMGVALGLFQTYILTLGQSIYRHLELKNYKAIGKAALMQNTIFGASSLPGFHQISETIGTHFSDNNVDLTTGTYKAVGDRAADFILYGLPSNMGPSFYTRGEVQPRVPNVLGGIDNVVTINFAKQTLDMLNHVKNAVGVENQDMARSLGQAISLQSMSRPVARLAEIATRTSITSKGNTVSAPEDVWTPVGVMARVLGTRPLQESKLREAIHLNSFYGSADHDRRQLVTTELKTAIRNDSLSDDKVAHLAEEYMRNGGSPTGWRSALNTALAQTNVSGKQALADKLKPNNPINYMINSLD